MRLRGGLGTPLSPIHSGFVEVFHDNEWGAICDGDPDREDLAADVVCRQLGFPHGTTVDPTTNPQGTGQRDPFTGTVPDVEESQEQQERFWLSGVSCSGIEGRLVDCRGGENFLAEDAQFGCSFEPLRLTVACRTFAVPEALEAVVTPEAGVNSECYVQVAMKFKTQAASHHSFKSNHSNQHASWHPAWCDCP